MFLHSGAPKPQAEPITKPENKAFAEVLSQNPDLDRALHDEWFKPTRLWAEARRAGAHNRVDEGKTWLRSYLGLEEVDKRGRKVMLGTVAIGVIAFGAIHMQDQAHEPVPVGDIAPVTTTTKDPCLRLVAEQIQIHPQAVTEYGQLLETCHQGGDIIDLLQYGPNGKVAPTTEPN